MFTNKYGFWRMWGVPKTLWYLFTDTARHVFIGQGKKSIALLSDGEPELMFKMFDHICISVDDGG